MLAAPEDVSVICLFLSWFNASTLSTVYLFILDFVFAHFLKKIIFFKKIWRGLIVT